MIKTHDDMRKDGTVSIFAGKVITDELGMDEYLRLEFSKDFGFEIYPPAAPESSQGEMQPFEDLFKGFSRANVLLSKAVSLAESSEFKECTSIVVFYFLNYDPQLINFNRSHKLEFLGTVTL